MKRISSLIGAAALAGAGLTAVTFTGLVSSPIASARTLAVPGSYRTIQSAVNAAHSGDTVLVNPGTYHETVTINGKYVVMRSNTADPSKTTIIGQHGRSAVEVYNVPRRSSGPRATVEGFHLYGATTLNGLGGGITLKAHSDALVEKNIIEHNSTTYGGGVFIADHSKPIVEYNTIRYNHASYGGGGICVEASSSPQIFGNNITSNTASGGRISGGGPSGGGIYATDIGLPRNDSRSYPNISRNYIANNTASFAGGGIVLGTAANAVVSSNHIIGNHSAYGGGVHIEDHGASPSLSINAIEHNTAYRSASFAGSGSGGGVSIFGQSRAILGHNSINYNTASYAGAGIVVAEGSNSPINGNRIYGNRVSDASLNGGGGGIYVAQSSSRITNNLIRSNSAGGGGGVAVLGTGTVSLANNDIINNVASKDDTTHRAYAGGLYVGLKSANTMSVVNNIIAGNNAYQIAEGTASTDALVTPYGNNLITNDGFGMYFNYHGVVAHSPSQFNGNPHVRYAVANTSTPPSFYNVGSGDVRLRSGSAGINQGRSSGAAGVDTVGRLRPVNHIVDIGVWEQ